MTCARVWGKRVNAWRDASDLGRGSGKGAVGGGTNHSGNGHSAWTLSGVEGGDDRHVDGMTLVWW